MQGGADNLQLTGVGNPTTRCAKLHFLELKGLREQIGKFAIKYVNENIHKGLAASTNGAANAAALIESQLLKFTQDSDMFTPLQIVLLLTKGI